MSLRLQERLGFGVACLVGLLVASPALVRAADPPRRPNIIFFMADDLGFGDLGCYGQQRIATPNLDRMAAEGMRFTQCYAGGTVCAPSRCVLMTGLHAGRCRIRGNSDVPLRPEDATVAEALRAAGYHTGIIGKWGLGDAGTDGVPTRKGFDEWFGYLNQRHAHNYYPEYLWRNETKVRLPGNAEKGGVSHAKGTYAPDLFIAEALEFLDRRREGPFFLYLAWTQPHANNEAGRALGDGMEVPDYGPYADKPWPQPERGRAAMIHRVDQDVGRILDRLRSLGIDDDTIVFFTSDNGPHSEGGSDASFFQSSGPLRGKKRDLYEGGIRVPMIVRWPGRIEAGAVRDYPWGFWDFFSTCVEIAGAPEPEGLDGRSVLPVLLGKELPSERWFYWEFHEGGFHQAVRYGPWKGVRRQRLDAPIELYDLSKDVGETTDLAEDHPDLAAAMRKQMKQMRTDSDEFPIREK
jgi:arylsulfatase A-like enzyme